MKQNILMATIFLATTLVTKADLPVFGNSANGSQGFNIIAYNTSIIIGGAVEFTPTENINVSSITLLLSGYTGISGETMSVSIWNNSSYQQGTATNTPGAELLSFTSPAANDGSLASFTFSNPSGEPVINPSGSTLLSANTAYWLVVNSYEEEQGTGYYGDIDWVGGGATTGDALYDGSIVYNYLPATSLNSSSIIPTFTINAVPEPGVASLMAIPMLLGIGRVVYKKTKGL